MRRPGALAVLLLLMLGCGQAAESPFRPERIAVLFIEAYDRVDSGNQFDHYAQARFRTLGIRSQAHYAELQG